MSSETNSNRPKKCLLKKAGVWALDLSSLGAQVLASSGAPMAGVPSLVVDKISNLIYKCGANKEYAQSLIDVVMYYEAFVPKILTKLNTRQGELPTSFESNSVPILEKVIAGVVEILDEIVFRCDKWLNKNFTKQMWSASKYDEELKRLKGKLDDYKKFLDTGLSMVLNENLSADLRQLRIEIQEGVIDSILQQLQQERESFAQNMLQSLQSKLEPLHEKLDKAQDKHDIIVDTLIGMNLSHNDRMGRLEDKINETLKLHEKKRDEERKSRKFRLCSSDSLGSRCAVVSESETPKSAPS